MILVPAPPRCRTTPQPANRTASPLRPLTPAERPHHRPRRREVCGFHHASAPEILRVRNAAATVPLGDADPIGGFTGWVSYLSITDRNFLLRESL